MARIHYLCANGHLYTAEVAPGSLNDGAYLTGVCPVDAAASKAQVAGYGQGSAAGVNVCPQVMLNGKSGGLQEGPAAAKGSAITARTGYSTYPGVYDAQDNLP